MTCYSGLWHKTDPIWLFEVWNISCTESDLKYPPFSHVAIWQLRSFALKTHVSIAISHIHPKLFLLIPETACSVLFTQILLSAWWQILMSPECWSGHPIALFTVYTLTNTHIQTSWWSLMKRFTGQSFLFLCLQDLVLTLVVFHSRTFSCVSFRKNLGCTLESQLPPRQGISL